MRKTNLIDWKIPLATEPFQSDSILETDNTGFAFYFSQIEEWSLMKYCSKLLIYNNKSAPAKIYDSGSAWFLFDVFNEMKTLYEWPAEKLVGLRQLINHGNNNYSFPFVIIHLEKMKYTTFTGERFEALIKDTNGKKLSERIDFTETKWMLLSELQA